MTVCDYLDFASFPVLLLPLFEPFGHLGSALLTADIDGGDHFGPPEGHGEAGEFVEGGVFGVGDRVELKRWCGFSSGFEVGGCEVLMHGACEDDIDAWKLVCT